MGDNIVLRMRFACWIIKATHTHRLTHTHTRTHIRYVKQTGFALQKLLGQHASILRCTLIASLLVIFYVSNCLLLYIQKNYV